MGYLLCIALGIVIGVTFVLMIGLFASRQDRQAENLREKAAEETETKNVKIIFKQEGREI